jgi:hypothetical protein
MPQLVLGHLRFTDEDYIEQEFKEKVEANVGEKSFDDVVNRLSAELKILTRLSFIHTYDRLENKNNIKKSLSNLLMLVTALVTKEGYSLQDLMKLNYTFLL